MLYGKIVLENGYVISQGYTSEELEELVADWRMNAEAIGSDLYDMTGDLAVGPQIVEDLLKHIKNLEAKIAT